MTNDNILSAALGFARAGFAVFPCCSEGQRAKSPMTSHGHLDATIDEKTIIDWFGRWPTALIGMPTGRTTKLMVIDVDIGHQKGINGFATLEQWRIENPQDPLPIGPRARTPRRGMHLYFRMPTDLDIRSRANVGVGVDVRAEGGYIITPPSVLASGERYRWLIDSKFDEVEAHEAPGWLIAKLVGAGANGANGANGGEAPPSLFGGELQDSGANGANGTTAADLIGQIQKRTTGWHDPVLRLVAHCVGKGMSDQNVIDLADQISWPGFTVAETVTELKKMIEGARRKWAVPEPIKVEAETPNGWPDPDLGLLGDGRLPAPTFPLEVLPDFWERWVVAAAAGACAPVDYVVGGVFSTTGAILANHRRPAPSMNWDEAAITWCALVGDPSSGKSPAMDALRETLKSIEKTWAKEHEENEEQYREDSVVAKARHDAWVADVKRAVADNLEPPRMPKEAVEPEMPVRRRLVIGDVTIEAVGEISAKLQSGLLVIRDELVGLFAAMDRYHAGGGGADRAFWLETYGGRSYTVDRKTSPSINIRNLAVGILGGINPDRISSIAGTGDDGFVARVLWFWPQESPQFKIHDEPVPSGAEARLRRLTELARVDDAPTNLRLDEQARQVLEEAGRRWRDEEKGLRGIAKGAKGKAPGQAIRLATIVTFLAWDSDAEPEPESVSAVAMKNAIRLIDEYFWPMALRVFSSSTVTIAELDAAALLKHLRSIRAAKFNARSVRRALGGNLRTADAMAAACNFLVEAGWIRSAPTRVGGSTGRRSSDFEVHPWCALGANSADSAGSALQK